MNVERLAIPDVLRLTPARHGDARGFLSETYRADRMREAGIDAAFVQDNHSLSRDRHVVRGLHCQVAPHAQGKLVRVVRDEQLAEDEPDVRLNACEAVVEGV